MKREPDAKERTRGSRRSWAVVSFVALLVVLAGVGYLRVYRSAGGVGVNGKASVVNEVREDADVAELGEPLTEPWRPSVEEETEVAGVRVPRVVLASEDPALAVEQQESEVITPERSLQNMAETERMIGAHAPLRAPSLADPDSEENRRILHQMVFKALSSRDAADTTIEESGIGQAGLR